MGRLTDVQATDGTRLSYAYDEHNNIQSYTAKKNGTTLSAASYTYTDEGLPVTATISAEYADIAYNYDTLNRLTSFEHEINGDVVSTNYIYKNGTQSGITTGQVSKVRYRYDGYDFGPHDDYTYVYDKNGNIVQITNGSLTISYTYDELNRLVRENNQQINKTITYSYDDGGNILNKKEYAYTTGTLGTPTDTIVYTYDTAWKDKLLTYDGGTTITYDEIGNPLIYNGYTFTWQKGRQLASASGNGKTITYKYGADGLRTQKTVNSVTTQYTYLSGLLVAQTDGTNTLRFSYTADGIPRSVNYNGTDYYYLYNLQGDVITIYSRNGTAVVNYTYDSWGKLISVTGSLASTLGALNPFRYRGYYYDTETGFYYLTTRYYDPDTGRFLNADGYISTGQGATGYNMFAYCGDNPVVNVDYTGAMHVKGTDGGCGSGGASSISNSTNINDTNSTSSVVSWFKEKIVDPLLQIPKKLSNQYESFINNTDESKVIEAKFLSGYKGTVVIKVPLVGGNAFSFGALFIGNGVADDDVIKHEYGHYLQLQEIGVLNYVRYVVGPSLKGYWSGVPYEDYYSQPWEYGADLYGSVVRNGYVYHEDVEEKYEEYWSKIKK